MRRFLPMMVEKARGDLAYAASLMLLASVVTVVYMPLAVPVMVKGFTADAWTIAKPLLLFLMVPLAIGIVIQRASESVTARLEPIVKKTTGINTILMLALCVVVYGKDFISAVGSYAFGTQILFFLVATAATYGLSFGLPQAQKSVLALGMSTRNLGAAFAPLFAVADIDQRAIVMVASRGSHANDRVVARGPLVRPPCFNRRAGGRKRTAPRERRAAADQAEIGNRAWIVSEHFSNNSRCSRCFLSSGWDTPGRVNIRGFNLGIGAVLLLVSVWACWRPRRRPPRCLALLDL